MNIFPTPRSLQLTGGHISAQSAETVVKIHDKLPPEHYSITISKDGIQLYAGDTAGLAYAQDTLAQIREQSGHELPCLELTDGPVFPERGYMLDISRCKVPTQQELLRFIDRLATLRYNQLQLYTEHTFAYAGHETVWRDSSPLSGEDIEELDAACAERHIELVPNQNSFGHLERWLRHPEYHHLAECPDGFTSPWGDFRQYGSTLKPNDDSLKLLDDMYSQLLPHFRSRKFNVGCDETFDLGMGWSRERAEAIGTTEIYLEFLSRIGQLVEKHGHHMRFWADVVLERPELIESLPAGSLPIIWGYERDHPFAEQCAQMAANGLSFGLAPGDSTWLSTHGRLDTARKNIAMATREGLKHKACGLLLTHWGDKGHCQPYSLALPALVLTAQHAWEGEQAAPENWQQVLSARILRDESGGLAAALNALGEIESAIDYHPHNRSPLYDALFQQWDDAKTLCQKLTAEETATVTARLDEAQCLLDAATPTCVDGDWLKDETQQAIRLTRLGLERLEVTRSGHSDNPLQAGIESAREQHKKLWLRRNRTGGLAESADYFTQARGQNS